MELFNNPDCVSRKRGYDDMLTAPEFSLEFDNEDAMVDAVCGEVPEVALERPQCAPNSDPLGVRAQLVQARADLLDMAAAIQQLKARVSMVEQKRSRYSLVDAGRQEAPELELRVGDAIETVWYADRPFPHFTVEVVDPATGSLRSDINNMKVEVTVRDGCGKDATHKLAASGASSPDLCSSSSASSSSSSCGDSAPLLFSVTNGTACVGGLRFTSVSSKCGGHFRLEFALIGSAPAPVCSLVSPPVQVLSYRLFHCRKLSAEQLTPDDSVSKMRGIGALYAKRLAQINVCTVRALAMLEVGDDSNEDCSVVALLRRDRGALTAAKLAEYVQQARAIVDRHHESQSDLDRPSKRRRVASPDASPCVQQQQQSLQAAAVYQHLVPASPPLTEKKLVGVSQPLQQHSLFHTSALASGMGLIQPAHALHC